VELKAAARVNGEIVTAALVVERGARFDGTVQMLRPQEPYAKPAAIV
jgi:cytoskeletal protein CcmA (bactofilin family)